MRVYSLVFFIIDKLAIELIFVETSNNPSAALIKTLDVSVELSFVSSRLHICFGVFKYQKISEMDRGYPFLFCFKSDFWMEW